MNDNPTSEEVREAPGLAEMLEALHVNDHPTMEEVRAALRLIMEKRRAEIEAAVEWSLHDVDNEPTGKLTLPLPIDVVRNRKGDCRDD